MVKETISIIMPCYNAELFIRQAIDSVLIQNYPIWELLIINDGSTDHSKDIILSYKDSRIRYYEQENYGVSAARNIGLKYMQGDYFCFLDSDDVLQPESLATRLAIFHDNDKIAFVDGRVEKRDENLNTVIDTYIPTFKGDPLSEILKLSTSCLLGNSWMIKRKNNRSYFFNTSVTHVEDFLFYLSIADGGLYSYTNYKILIYRARKNSAMKNLIGLENGYLTFIKEASKHPNFNLQNRIFLKIKILKIMVLSYLNEGKIINCLLVFFNLLFK